MKVKIQTKISNFFLLTKNFWGKTKSFVLYLIKSKSRYRIHSKFVYDFVEYVRAKEELPPQVKFIEEWRKELKKNKTLIKFLDWGAKGNGNFRESKLSSIVKSSVSHRKGVFLYKCAKYVNGDKILELGTSLGISAAYLAISNKKITTIEGSPEISNLALSFFQRYNFSNISLVQSRFETAIENFIKENEKFDLIFLDGDHSPLKLRYYLLSLPQILNEEGILVVDDIRYSSALHKMWREVSQNIPLLLIIEFFNVGIIFNSERFQKERYVVLSTKIW